MPSLHDTRQETASTGGDFYVESECCLSCGVPQHVAPDLVGWTDQGQAQCYWKKQPENDRELQQAFAVFDGQEAGCHRYAGNNPAIQKRIGLGNCDVPASENLLTRGPLISRNQP